MSTDPKRSTRRPSVLIIGPTPPPHHGMTTATLALLNSSLTRQFDLIHLDTSDRRGVENMGRWDWENIRLALEHGARFVWLLATRRPDVVMVPLSQNRPSVLRDFQFLFPARLARRRVVVHLHGSFFREYYDREHPLMRALIRPALSRVAAAVVLGERARPIFEGLVPSHRILVVPNGVEADALLQIPRPNGSHAPHVLFLSNLARSKGFVDVVHASPMVARAVADVRFTLAGAVCDPEASAEAGRLVQQHGLHERVLFPGMLTGDAKRDAFARASVFVMPTSYKFEGQPYAILEAMAAGLPVVTTDQGLIGETVKDGVNGFLVPAHDPGALADKIVMLLRDSALREKMGRAGRERYLQEFTLDRWIDRMQTTFEAAVSV